MSNRLPAPRAALVFSLVGFASAMVLGLVGCGKPLFSPKDQRTQYDRFDAVRGQYEPQDIEDEFGRKRPNLRGRLLPKS